MGSENTARHKHNIANAYITKAKEQGKNIDKEMFIRTLMVECLCERRKAQEIINAQATYNGLIEEKINGKKVYKVENA